MSSPEDEVLHSRPGFIRRFIVLLGILTSRWVLTTCDLIRSRRGWRCPIRLARGCLSSHPGLTVSYKSGLLSIHADQATLGEVLNAVHRETGADIPIPLGIENDKIVVELGPARPSVVLTSLLNGTPYNFILIGSSDDPTGLRSVILKPRDAVVSAADFRGTTQQNQPPSAVSTPNGASAGSFRNRNKESFISFPPAVPPPDPATAHAATPEPSSQPSDQELSTPPPAAPDPPQSPPRL